jgi:hypothetical protein
MSVISKADLLKKFSEIVGDDNSDKVLDFMGDLSDTMDDYDTKTKGDGVDWKAKYEENDKNLRQKYRDRFNEPVQTGNADTQIQQEQNDGLGESEPQLKTSFEELFE